MKEVYIEIVQTMNLRRILVQFVRGNRKNMTTKQKKV